MCINFKLSFLYIIMGIMGCSESVESNISTINVPESNDVGIQLRDIAKSVKTIPLETNKDALLGWVYNIKLHNEKLYIVDRHKVLIFDMEGNFIDQLGRIGDGPGEYRGVSSFTIDPNTGNVYVASDYRVLIYTADSKLLIEKKFPHGTYNMEFADGKLYKFMRSVGNELKGGFANYTSLLELSPKLELRDSIPIKTVYLKKKTIARYPYMHFISKNQIGTYLYYPVLTPENIYRDTLYQLKSNELIPFIKLDFERPQIMDDSGLSKTGYIYNIINSNSYLLCEYEQNRERQFFIYNKNDSTSYNLKKGLLDEQGDYVVLRPLDLEKDIFFYVKTVEYIDGDTEESNPTIGIVKLK